MTGEEEIAEAVQPRRAGMRFGGGNDNTGISVDINGDGDTAEDWHGLLDEAELVQVHRFSSAASAKA